jgi:hypothetical protein
MWTKFAHTHCFKIDLLHQRYWLDIASRFRIRGSDSILSNQCADMWTHALQSQAGF